MADVVIFDPDNLLIVEIGNGLLNETDVVEIYSEWKDWLLADPSRLGYPQAFSVVGGDPISPVKELGSTFFLENKWRLRPAELDHKWRLNGNLFTREAGESVSVPTVGAYNVVVEMSVSNLVDGTVAGAVWDEPIAGHAIVDTTGYLLTLLRKALTNRLEASPGNPGSLVLYDDDGLTALLSWSTRDDAGGAVVTAPGAPGRRGAAT
jgi:hypothetical protein